MSGLDLIKTIKKEKIVVVSNVNYYFSHSIFTTHYQLNLMKSFIFIIITTNFFHIFIILFRPLLNQLHSNPENFRICGELSNERTTIFSIYFIF